MRVGLNALYMVPGDCGGLETYATEIIAALNSRNSNIEYVVFVSLDAKYVFAGLNKNISVVVCPFHARNRAARYCWEQFVLPWQAIAYGIDVLHSLAYVGPILSPVPTLVTIHDANSKVTSVSMSPIRRTVLWNVSRLAAKTADLVTTVSHFSRQELAERYGLRLEDIDVIPSGPGSHLVAQGDAPSSEIGTLIAEGPYIAAIGGGYPHKNMARLIEAFRNIEGRTRHRLIILGHISGAQFRGGIPEKIRCTGYLTISELQQVLRCCDLFVMPSLYEGFGFPVLEAQTLGAPVACSRTTSLVELTNQTAALFDPENVDEIASVMERCILNRTLNSELRTMSKENAARFSWAQSAHGYELAYRSVGHKARSWLRHGFRCILRLT